MSRAILEETLRLIDEGREFTVATVADAQGSVPAKAGSKMIVLSDGRTIGTVGGAGLEEKVKGLSRQCIAERRGGIFRFDLSYYKEGGLDSLCGGSVQIIVEYYPRLPHVLICGGGHVGLAVARALVPLEYAYSVLDDRVDFARRERFPEARQVYAARPEEFFGKEDLTKFTHMLLVGYSHQIDTQILFESLQRFDGWIGLIASKMKRREMFHRVKARGITDEQLARVEAPVGVRVGAVTVPEIAVEIAASIVRHYRQGAPGDEADVEEAEQAGRST